MLSSLTLEREPLFCLAAAMVLVYVPYVAVILGRMQVGMDLHAPRALFDRLPDYAKRATWAHQNGFETFPAFAAAVLIAYVSGPHPQPLALGWSGDLWLAVLATLYLPARLLHSGFYIADIPAGRSLAFGFGSLSAMGILGIGLLA